MAAGQRQHRGCETSPTQVGQIPSDGLLTDVERRVAGPRKVIYVGNAKGLDGHRAQAEEQLGAAHEQPQVVGVSQTPVLVSATGLGRSAGVGMQVADVVAICHPEGEKRDYFNFLELLRLRAGILDDTGVICPRAK